MNEYSVGNLVKFRGREWVVMPSQDHNFLPLRPLIGGEQEECGLFLPLESSHLRQASFPLPQASDLGDLESARLLRDAARLLLRHGAGPFRCMGHLSFTPRPYQLVPLLMALRLNPVRMLLADDVGVGKTIEAGLIARELLDRGEFKRIAVVCPPYLCDQWQRELATKFNIDAKIVRSNTLARLERELPRPSLSVFEYYSHLVVSIDYVKSSSRRDAFLLHAPDFVIVDEAHSCARPFGDHATQQQRHRLIADLAKKNDRHLVLVTATPHSGIEESFLSVLGLLNPKFEQYSLERISQPQRSELAQQFIQRTRRDVEGWMNTETVFPKREAFEVSFVLTSEYKALFNEVYQFARQVVMVDATQSAFRQRVRYWAALALLRCVMSSPAAAKAALLSRLESRNGEAPSDEVDFSAEVHDPTDIESAIDVTPTHVVTEGDAALSDPERRKLRSFIKKSETLAGSADAKIAKAEQEIRALLKEGLKPIVFCRFIATAEYVAEQLTIRLKKDFPELHILAATGALSDDEREQRVEELGKSKHRLLVATDCLSEGINLQEQFSAVVHYDLPWNPNRLEQREGRVDRFGQNAKTVKTVLLYGADNPIDGAVLNVLLRKARKIHKELGILVPLPVDSESVIDAVLKAIFLRADENSQLELFYGDEPVKEVHRQWDAAKDREKQSRALFAQHGIQPEEIAKELQECDDILGNADVVQRFVHALCQRAGVPCVRKNGHWKLDAEELSKLLRDKIAGNDLSSISFDSARSEEATTLTRNHPLVARLAEFVFENALIENGKREISARLGVVRSQDVQTVTTLLILRVRFQVQNLRRDSSSLAEECLITGFTGTNGSELWLSEQEARALFDNLKPAATLSVKEKASWVSTVMSDIDSIQRKLKKLVAERAEKLLESHKRLTNAVNGSAASISIQPILPVDVLAAWIVLPVPRV